MKQKSRFGWKTKTFARASSVPFLGGYFSYISFLILALGLLFLSAGNPKAVSVMRTSAIDIFAPVVEAINSPIQSAVTYTRNMSGLASLQEDNLILQEENQRLRAWYQKALLLEEENRNLRALANLQPEKPATFNTARVISDAGSRFFKTLLVNAGKTQGVDVNDSVLSAQGLIGRVIETGEQTSRILLATDINSRIPVLISGSGNHAVLAGQNNAMPKLLYLPKDLVLEKGMTVVTSGQGGIFPYGLPIGKVVQTVDGEYAVALYTDFHRLMYVRITRKPDDPNLRTGN